MLTREEQYSIVSFTERHPRLPRVRQQELAEQLCYDLQMPSANPIETVLGMGKYYLGQQQKEAARDNTHSRPCIRHFGNSLNWTWANWNKNAI